MKGLSTVICVIVIGFLIGTVNPLGVTRCRVTEWKKIFRTSDFCKPTPSNCSDQITEAETKGKEQSGDDKIRAAVEIIYIYSSNYPPTYQKLNAVLRGDPNRNVSVTDDLMFKRFARLLELSIATLCQKFPNICGIHNIVYRGQGYCLSIPFETTNYTFKSFLSTSKLIQEAEKFYNECSTSSLLFKMAKVEGIYIRNFSKYDFEEEVLIKPPTTFRILENLNSLNDESHSEKIRDKIRSLHRTKNPKAYIYAIMSPKVKSGLKRSITAYPCESIVPSDKTDVSSGAQYVGSATAMLVMCTVYHIFFLTLF